MSVHHALVPRSRSLGKGREAEGPARGCGNEASAPKNRCQNVRAAALQPYGNFEGTYQNPEEPQLAAVLWNGQGKSLIADDALQR